MIIFKVGAVVFTIVPFCPSVLWAQLITKSSTWRYVGLLVGLWNFIGLVLVLVFYRDPARVVPRPKKEVLREVDYIGGFLSTAGVTCFMLGLQFGASQVWIINLITPLSQQNCADHSNSTSGVACMSSCHSSLASLY